MGLQKLHNTKIYELVEILWKTGQIIMQTCYLAVTLEYKMYGRCSRKVRTV